MNDSTIGSRIQAARLVAGLTQRELAQRSKVSLSLIRMLEQEERQTTGNETLNKLASALRTTTTRLSGGTPDAGPAESADVAEWEKVRQAALGNHRHPAAEEPTLAGTKEALKALMPLMIQARYTELRQSLPGLLADCDALVEVSGDDYRGRHVRSTARQLVAFMLGQTWQLAEAADVLRLAADDAAGDPGTEQAAATWLTWILLRSGDLDGCASLASDWADRCEPRISRATLGEFGMWGRLQLYVATCAARDSRPGEAATSLRWARAAAAAAGRDFIPKANPWDVYGPVTVEMTAGEIALVQGNHRGALEIAERVDATGVPVPRNVLRHKLDVARAYATAPAQTGLQNHAAAVGVLSEVQDAAPEWLAQQRGAAETLSAVMKPKRKLPDEVADLARTLRMVL